MTWHFFSPGTYHMTGNGRHAYLHTFKGSMLYTLELIDGPRTVTIEKIGGESALKRARGFCKCS